MKRIGLSVLVFALLTANALADGISGGVAAIGGGGGGGAPTGSAGGDLSGSYPSPTLSAAKSASFLPTSINPTINTTATAPTVGALNYYDTTSGALAPVVPLANSVPAGTIIGFAKTDATVNALTATLSGSDHVDLSTGAVSIPVRTQNQKLYLRSDGTAIWSKLLGDLSLPALDLRYASQLNANLTGVPIAPTATNGTNTTQIATTAFVLANASSGGVTTFNGRSGPVVPAVNDYSFAQLSAPPTTIAGYGITDGVSTSVTYSNPAWISGLNWSKILGAPTTIAGYGITDAASAAALQAQGVLPTPIKTVNYTAACGDFVLVDATSGPITITAPSLVPPCRWGIRLATASANAVTASTGTGTFDTNGASTLVFATGYAFLDVTWGANSAGTQWVGTSSGKPNGYLASLFASINNAALTGTPTAPTATAGTNTTQIATTAFVLANAGSGGGAITSVTAANPSVVVTPTTGAVTVATSFPLQAAKTGTGYTVLASDQFSTIPLNASTALTVTINAPSSSYFPSNTPICFANYNITAAKITPVGSAIYGLPLTTGSLVVPQYANICLQSDGTNYLASGYVPAAVSNSTTVLTPQGRLSLNASAVQNADAATATTVNYLPYSGRQAPIYTGANWVQFDIGASGLALSVANATNFPASSLFDVYLFSNAGTATLCATPWGTSTAGASSRGASATITTQDGLYVNGGAWSCNAGATTYTLTARQATLLGSFVTTPAGAQVAGQFAPAAAAGGPVNGCFIGYANIYNTIPATCLATDSNVSFTSTVVGYSAWDSGATGAGLYNRVSWVDPIGKIGYRTLASAYMHTSVAADNVGLGVGINSVTAPSGILAQMPSTTSTSLTSFSSGNAPQVNGGLNFAQLFSYLQATGTGTYIDGSTPAYTEGLQVTVSF